MIPELAPVQEDRDDGGGSMLDLLPHEWHVLTMIDGERDLRGIAALLGRDGFEVAKIAYGLATTGVIWLRAPARVTQEFDMSDVELRRRAARMSTKSGRHGEAADALRHAIQEDPLTPGVHADLGFASARAGDLVGARASWEHVLRLAPDDPMAGRVRAALDALTQFEQLLTEEANG